MSNLYTIIKELQNASGSNAKTAILEANKDNELLKVYLKALYDPSISYYQTRLPKIDKSTPIGTLGSELINWFIAELGGRKVTGSLAVKCLKETLENVDTQSQELIELLIKRSIGAGVGDTMILKVFPDLYFIPPYQRCSLMDAKVKDRFSKLKTFFVQEKLDGSFCYLVKEAGKAPEAITRAGSKYPTEFAEKLAVGLPDGFVVVGELLVYGEAATLGVPLDRKTGNGVLNSVLKGCEVGDNLGFEMTAWDCLTAEAFKSHKSTSKYYQRLNLLENVLKTVPNIRAVHTEEVNSLEEAYQVYSGFTAEGKEGAVIKTTDFLWRDGTSRDCIKLKIEFEVDLEVIGWTEGTGKAKGMLGSLTVASSDRLLVSDLGTGFSDMDREDWWGNRNLYIGKIITVKANDIISKRDSKIASLFLPVYLDVRFDKTEADSYARCVYQLHCAKNGGVK